MATAFTTAQIASLATAFAISLTYTTVDHNGYVIHVTTPINLPADADTALTNIKNFVASTLGLSASNIYLYMMTDPAKVHFYMGTTEWTNGPLYCYEWN